MIAAANAHASGPPIGRCANTGSDNAATGGDAFRRLQRVDDGLFWRRLIGGRPALHLFLDHVLGRRAALPSTLIPALAWISSTAALVFGPLSPSTFTS